MALSAAGVEKKGRQGVQSRIEKSDILTKRRDFLEVTLLKAAIEARNAAAHDHSVPSPEECNKHISTLHAMWSGLRRMFVTKKMASAIAEALTEKKLVNEVFLFGSIAQRKPDPKDIDLLLFDDGSYSAFGSSYYADLGLLSDLGEVTEQLFAAYRDTRAAIKCGWLDYIIVDGSRFGTDADYTVSLSNRQRDPLFFLNISVDLLKFDKDKGTWRGDIPQTFKRLRLLRSQLVNEKVVPKTWNRKFIRGKA